MRGTEETHRNRVGIGIIDLIRLRIAAGPEIEDDYGSITERLIDYIELVTEYDRSKVFVLFNLRCLVTTEEIQAFVREVLKREYQVILIDSNEYPLLDREQRVLIDESLCEIC